MVKWVKNQPKPKEKIGKSSYKIWSSLNQKQANPWKSVCLEANYKAAATGLRLLHSPVMWKPLFHWSFPSFINCNDST